MYKIYSVLRRGSLHLQHCEDYLLNLQKERFIFTAVLDGCSGGEESYFASALLGKLLRKIFRNADINTNLELAIKYFTQELFADFYRLSQEMDLALQEQLSTLIMLLMDTETKESVILAMGDGIIVADKELIVLDQKNKPDYLAYHLPDLLDTKMFEIWWANNSQRYFFSGTKNLVISTDGLLSFYKSDVPVYRSNINDVVYEMLVKSNILAKSTAKLTRSLNILKNKFNLVHYDDLAMIRICEQD